MEFKGRIGQLGFQVKDVKKIESFYKEKIGLKHLFTVPDCMTFFDCDGVRLMFSIRESGETLRANSIIYFKVRNIEEVFEHWMRKDIEEIAKPHKIAEMHDHDLWMAFVKDAEENVIGIMEEKQKN